jgi:hypothetical protein
VAAVLPQDDGVDEEVQHDVAELMVSTELSFSPSNDDEERLAIGAAMGLSAELDNWLRDKINQVTQDMREYEKNQGVPNKAGWVTWYRRNQQESMTGMQNFGNGMMHHHVLKVGLDG